MKAILMLLLVSFCLSAASQETSLNIEKDLKYKSAADSLLKRYKETRALTNGQKGVLRLAPRVNLLPAYQQTPDHKMPIKKLDSEGTYKGNNGRGSDIYAMTPDNMPCLVPDSTYHTNMPVAGRNPKLKFLDKKEEATLNGN